MMQKEITVGVAIILACVVVMLVAWWDKWHRPEFYDIELGKSDEGEEG